MSSARGVFGPGPRSTADGFVGREAELERVATLLLDSARLITLVGPGGIGKTRLAMEVSARLRRARRGPVYWVRLARLPKGAAPAEVEDEIARSVVDGDFSGRPVRAALLAALDGTDTPGRGGHPLLVLDNCEHVLDGVGPVVAELLDGVPGLSVLATSRTALGWVDEQLLPIAPLPNATAVQLFRQRAALTGRAVGESERATVESICRHLHNYPLFIRLAAARLRYQPLPAILRDLDGAVDRRLRWSPGFRVGDEERHRDIASVIAWSFDLCGDAERLLFERMSVFAAGYDADPAEPGPDSGQAGVGQEVGAELDAIEAVCADADLPAHEIEPLLEQLADRSLVSIHIGAETVRYSLLESFRLYAEQRVRARGDGHWERLAARHRRYYRDQLVAARWVGPHEQHLLSWARAAWDNLLCAIDSSLTDPVEAVVGLEIATGLIALRIPFLRGLLRESRQLAERSLDAVRSFGGCPPELEISALALIGWLALCQGMSEDAGRMLDQCVATSLGTVPPGWRDDPAVDLGLPAPVDYLWGSVLLLTVEQPPASVVLARARAKFAAAGDTGGAAMSELFESLAAAFYGTPEVALETTRRHLATMTESGAQWAISWAKLAAAIATTAHGDPAAAEALCDSAVRWQRSMGDQWGGVWALHIRSWIAARRIGDSTDAAVRIEHARRIARLYGETSALRRRLGIDLTNLRPFAAETVKATDLARSILRPADFDAAVAEGQVRGGMARPEPIEDSVPAGAAPETARDSRWEALTAAEQEVAVLAAAGLTNTAIAARRGTSNRTVDAQVAAILPKLMIGSRREILPNLPAPQRDRAERESRRRSAAH